MHGGLRFRFRGLFHSPEDVVGNAEQHAGDHLGGSRRPARIVLAFPQVRFDFGQSSGAKLRGHAERIHARPEARDAHGGAE